MTEMAFRPSRPPCCQDSTAARHVTSRHRVAVWRRLRRVGAVPVFSGVCALPAGPAFKSDMARSSRSAFMVCAPSCGRHIAAEHRKVEIVAYFYNTANGPARLPAVDVVPDPHRAVPAGNNRERGGDVALPADRNPEPARRAQLGEAGAGPLCWNGGENPQDLRFRCARRRTPTLQQHFLDHLHRCEIAFQGERPMGVGRVSQSGLVAFGGVVPLRHTRGRRVWPESPSHGQNVSAGKTYARSRRPWMATSHTGSTRPVAGLCRTFPPVRPARTCPKSPKQTGGIRGPVPTENPGWTPPTQNPPTPGIPTTSAALRPLWQSPFHGGRPPSALPGSAWAGAPFREPAPQR